LSFFFQDKGFFFVTVTTPRLRS